MVRRVPIVRDHFLMTVLGVKHALGEADADEPAHFLKGSARVVDEVFVSDLQKPRWPDSLPSATPPRHPETPVEHRLLQ